MSLLFLCFLLFLALALFVSGFVFIFFWRRAPSTFEGARPEYLRKGDRNALLGYLFVAWGMAASLVVYSVTSLSSG